MKDWFGLVARLVTGGVWIVAGALKLPYPADSVRAVRAYDLLPETVVPAVGHLLPVVEVVIGLCLVLGVLVRSASAVSALLFVAFIIGISSAWARGLSIDCGCFGGGGEIPDAAAKYPGEIARDVGLLALSVWLVVRPRSRLALDTVLFRSSPDHDTDHDHDLDTDHDIEGSLDGAEEDLAQDR
ncbi:MauE/DoxX family redox-associated membrane protein [Nocardioides sp.]|uniref:MauE/DoxX family redox-associated membrane protein n=1 Tax=Nocardioides sp. TaxID=35761 RepID=UPI0035B0029D